MIKTEPHKKLLAFLLITLLLITQFSLGKTNLVTDSKGALVEVTSYSPYGEVIEGGNDRFTYNAKEKDSSSLYYYGARYYKADTFKHFIQCDTIKPDIHNPQALNCYAYVLNNPYKYVDKNGNYAETFLDIGFIAYDINELRQEQSPINYLALGADIVGAALPIVTGLGVGVRGTVKVVDLAKDASKEYKVSDIMKSKKNFEKAVQEAVNKADPGQSITRLEGTEAHKEVKNILKNQGVPESNLEISRIGSAGVSRTVTYGERGSSRADAIYHSGNTLTVYDFKFGNAQMSNAQLEKYFKNFGKEDTILNIKIVKPNQLMKKV